MYQLSRKLARLLYVAGFFICAQSSLSGGWGQGLSADLVYLPPSVNGAFLTQEVMVNPDGCSLPDFYVLNKTNSNYDEIYSLVLAARVAGLPVQFHVCGCFYQRPEISLAQL